MKMIKKLPFAFILAFLFIACDNGNDSSQNDNTPSESINQIMPLGASRVEGARPEFESYRYELWKDLIDGGWEFDFIGTQNDIASYPDYQGQSFDEDHEGRGGWTSGQIRSGIAQWVGQVGVPDIVLFSSPGGNDALQGLPYEDIVDNVNDIIDFFQQENPNVIIIIEQLAPARSDEMTDQLTNYFDRLQQDVVTIAEQQSNNSSQVVIVDMFTGFTDSLLADDVHYNEAGAAFIAEQYYSVLIDILEE